MTQQHPGLSVIGQIAIPVKDIKRAVVFYQDTLGMKFLFEAPPALTFFDCNGVRVMLDVPEDKEFDHPASPIYFKVADIKAKKMQFRQEPHIIAKMGTITLWMAFFYDGESNTLTLMSEVRN